DRGPGTGPAAAGSTAPVTTAVSTATPGATAPAPGPTAAPSRSTSPSALASSPSTKPYDAPPGYKHVSDLRGFSMVVPESAVRSDQGERIFYITPDESFRVGIKIGKIPPGGAMASMRAADAAGPKNNPGFRDNSITPTTRHGMPAALWQFTWDGFDAAKGSRHTYDLCWEGNGRLYDVWVSGPADRAGETRAHFDKAVESFFPYDH
ncbi:MAG TPA: serine/threonine protein kinase, partial [Streptomyces sp.]